MHSTPAPRPPTPFEIDDALAVVHSPAHVHDQPRRRCEAWQTLKAARGQTMRLGRIIALAEPVRRAHINAVADEACVHVHRNLTARDLHLGLNRCFPAVPDAPFWDDVDPAHLDVHHGPDLNGAA